MVYEAIKLVSDTFRKKTAWFIQLLFFVEFFFYLCTVNKFIKYQTSADAETSRKVRVRSCGLVPFVAQNPVPLPDSSLRYDCLPRPSWYQSTSIFVILVTIIFHIHWLSCCILHMNGIQKKEIRSPEANLMKVEVKIWRWYIYRWSFPPCSTSTQLQVDGLNENTLWVLFSLANWLGSSRLTYTVLFFLLFVRRINVVPNNTSIL